MNKENSQVLPNRKEWRASMRRFKHSRVAKKTKTKGAFGQLSEYMRDIKKKSDLKIAEKLELKKAKFAQPTDTKKVTKQQSGVETEVDQVLSDKITQPVDNKEVKEKTDEK